MMQIWIAISARETSRTGSAKPANRPQATRRRNIRAKKKMLVTLKPKQRTTPPLKNTKKVVSTTRNTTAKTPCYWMWKTLRKKLHRGTKANCYSRIGRRGLTTTMMMITEPVPRTTTDTETAKAEVTGIPALEEAPRNGWGY